MYDPTVEITRKEISDEFNNLLSMGHTRVEAAEILDTEYMDWETWCEMYGEEVKSQGNYSILEFENQPLFLEIGA